MNWNWNDTNWLWQVVNNPGNLLNPISAKSWLAQNSAANWQTGNLGNMASAVFQDAAGGYVTMWTGSPASTAQGWWAVGLSVPAFVITGETAAARGLAAVSNSQAISSAFSTAYGFYQGTQSGVYNTYQAGVQVVGLGGSLVSGFAERFPGGIALEQGSQYVWNFVSQGTNQLAGRMQSASRVIDSFVMGNSIGDAINGPSGGTPKVGGVLFENCDAVLTGIHTLTGAYWDPKSASLVLVGKSRAGGVNELWSLPFMDSDHFHVALRAALVGQPLGVSIDPPAEYRDGIMRGESPPDGTQMWVSYLGCDGALFGAIMFEADRLLKNLDKGVDNNTREPVRANVPGFQPLLHTMRPDDGSEHIWRRFWFLIKTVKLKHDPAVNSIVFGDVGLKVSTELDQPSQQETAADKNAEEFARILTDRYDEFAKNFGVLARLTELAKITALAKFIVNQKLPLDPGTLFETPPVLTATPSSTPGISVVGPNEKAWMEGNTIHRRRVSLFGGVYMDAEPVLVPDPTGEARALRQRSELNRPSPASTSWSFAAAKTSVRAIHVPLTDPQRIFRRTCEDHQFSGSTGSGMLSLRRVYRSNRPAQCHFGPGWKLWTPVSLTIVSSNGKRIEVLTKVEAEGQSLNREILLLHDHATETTGIYRPANADRGDAHSVFARVTGQTLERGRVSFEFDPTDSIERLTDGYRRVENRQTFVFDLEGRLSEVQENGRWVRRYRWQGALPDMIESFDGRWYKFIPGPAGEDRIIAVNASDGAQMNYLYDQQGCLRYCREREIDSEAYAYDGRHRLTEVRDRRGMVTTRAIYNGDNGRVASIGDVNLTEDMCKIERFVEKGRVTKARDQTGTQADFEYGTGNELSTLSIRDENQRTWRFDYDASGWLASFEDSRGRTTRFQYAPHGTLEHIVDSQGGRFSIKMDPAGRLVGWTDSSGCESALSFDDNHRLIGITDLGSRQWHFGYEGSLLIHASGPDGIVTVSPRKKTLTVKIHNCCGWWQKQTFDRQFRLIRTQSSLGTNMRLSYDSTNILSLQNEAGMLRFQHHQDRVTVKM